MHAHYGAGGDGGGGRRAAPLQGDAGLYFLGSLHELVAVGLHRPALEALCAGQRDLAEPPIDRAYLLKVLDEEISRQFGHPLRPLIELVLNAADAARGPQPLVDVAVTDGRVDVCDTGVGMGLRAILSRLLIPFATDKRPGIDLGRFGVGFFSVLGFGLSDPESFSLHLTTGDGIEGWAIRVVPWPGAGDAPDPPASAPEEVGRARGRASPELAAALMCSVRRIAPLLGTRVRVTSALLEAGAVRAYLRDALHFFPASRALVLLDGAAVNDGRLISGGQLVQEPIAPSGRARGRAAGPAGEARATAAGEARATAAGEARATAAGEARAHPEDAAEAQGSALLARFHIGGRGLLPSIAAATFHAGVKVDACLALAELALIDFPAAVELTEGRDALKVGPEFTAVATAFYRRLIQLAAASGEGRRTRDRLAEMAAQISALMLQSAGWDEVARDLARALLGPGRCMVTPERREALLGFLGPSVAERLFVPESFWAEREWQPHLPGERELLEDELELDPAETLSALARRRGDLAGLPLLLARAANPHTTMVALCRSRLPPDRGGAGAAAARRAPGAPPLAPPLPEAAGRRPPGPLPCLGTRRLLLIRDDSPAVRRPSGWSDWYALRAAFDRASGVREADLERDLIVGEPVDGAACAAPRPGERTSGGEP
ncbi:ATP-binding protein [Sorangium sp. So ce233]|uniref:ATP-binding protein n=1 Tax=Sorangium sp. So ce233 TaxID=3133290 RepID=UPI003F617A59